MSYASTNAFINVLNFCTHVHFVEVYATMFPTGVSKGHSPARNVPPTVLFETIPPVFRKCHENPTLTLFSYEELCRLRVDLARSSYPKATDESFFHSRSIGPMG